MVKRDKQCYSLQTFVNYGRKKFCSILLWWWHAGCLNKLFSLFTNFGLMEVHFSFHQKLRNWRNFSQNYKKLRQFLRKLHRKSFIGLNPGEKASVDFTFLSFL